MSWATCYSGSNNIHFNTPALMNDGRLFSNYDSSCKSNKKLKESLGINNNYSYRQWLIHNGNSVINKNKDVFFNNCSGCVKQASQAPSGTKYLFKDCADNSTPFGYENSDLKKLYVSRHTLQSKLKAPIMTQEQLLLSRASKCSLGNSDSAGKMKSCEY